MMDSTNLLKIRNLHLCFHKREGIAHVVEGVNIDIGRHEIVGLVGGSGCGKTLTALSIMRLLPRDCLVTNGQIIFEHQELLNISNEEMRKMRGKFITMIFQDPSTFLNPVLKISTHLEEAMRLHMPKESIREKMIELLRAVEVSSPEKVLNYYPHQLSGGMKQRIVIAMALVPTVKLIIADEPTTNLDVSVQAQILRLVRELVNKTNSSLLYISHDLATVAQICSRVYVMYGGKIVEQGSIEAIIRSPHHPYTNALLAAVPTISKSSRTVLQEIDGFPPDPLNKPCGCVFSPRCKQAQLICEHEQPHMVKVANDHEVSCWNMRFSHGHIN